MLSICKAVYFIRIIYNIFQHNMQYLICTHILYNMLSNFWSSASEQNNERKYILTGHWTSIAFFFLNLILWRILNFFHTKIFSWFCQCIFLLWGILWTPSSSSVCPIGKKKNRKCYNIQISSKVSHASAWNSICIHYPCQPF